MSELIRILSARKGTDIAGIARTAEEDSALLSLLLKNTRSKNDTLRYNCYRVLLEVSAAAPQALFRERDVLLEMLDSANNYFRYQAVALIANLLCADSTGQFAGIEDRYFRLIDDESIMIASHLALNAGKIARAKPELRGRVTVVLLEAGRRDRGAGNADFLHASLIEGFSSYFPEAPRQAEILAYVRDQAARGSQKTRKAAREFIRLHAPEEN